MGISGDLFRKNDKPEEPSVYVGMTAHRVVSEFKERGFSEIAAKRTLTDVNGKILYSYKPRKDIPPIHPSWIDSYFELFFENGKLSSINWYKKDNTPLELHKQKLYLGPK